MSRKITHIGVVVRDLEAAIRLWEENFGFKETHRVDIDVECVRTAMLSPTGFHGEMAVELIEPMDKDNMRNPIARHLARAGEGFYQLAMIVDDAEAARKTLMSRGVTVIERPPASVGAALRGIVNPSACRQVVHPKSSNGILIELLQSDG